MSRACILTDSTAQFPAAIFPGHELVNVIPLHIKLDGQLFTDGKELKASGLPASARKDTDPKAFPPTEDEYHQVFSSLSRKYNEIILLTMSSHLSQVHASAVQAASSMRGPASIHVIDSQTASVGLGLLVQVAAAAAQSGASSVEITRQVRGLVPHVYTVFCVQSLSYLYHSGHLDPAQAIVGEMLGVSPFFILESGRLVPIQKIRNSRHLVDILHEFIAEFANLKHIAIIQGVPPFDQEARSLRDRINGDFPGTTISEHTVSASMATILGPRSLGVVVMENCTDI